MAALIVPVNFSPASSNAALYAIKLAKERRAEVHLLHVMVIQPSITHSPLPDNLINQMKDDAKFSMIALEEKLKIEAAGDVSINHHIELGSVEHQLELLCSRKHAEFVVMGLSHESAQKTIYQSSAFSVLKSLPVPLIIVPDNATFTSWKHVALAYDFANPVKELPLEKLISAGSIANSTLHLVYVKRKNEADPSQATMQGLRSQLPGVELRFHLVEAESVDEGLATYTEHNNADLVVLLPKHHNFFEFHKSDSKRIMRHLSVPMLSVPAI